ncbi:hypothetical protein ACO0LH_04705 [Undibacterium sp. TJN19]
MQEVRVTFRGDVQVIRLQEHRGKLSPIHHLSKEVLKFDMTAKSKTSNARKYL